MLKLGILSTGNELVPASTPELPPGKIRDSNKCMLMAVAGQLPNVEPIDLGTISDTGAEIHRAMT